MSDVSFTLEANSNQLNALDIAGAEPIITIRDVKVEKTDQPVSVYFDGDNNKPWKPSKGMRRVLAGAWGRESKDWIGKKAQLYFEPSVKYAGQEVGGIRIRALSDISEKGMQFAITISRNKREPFIVKMLEVKDSTYPEDKFKKAFPVMARKLQNEEMTLQQVIAQCQKTGTLTPDMIKKLEDAVPDEIEDEIDPETGEVIDDEQEIF